MRLLAGVLFLLVTVSPAFALGPPKSDLWPRWAKHDPASTQSVDHGDWGSFLKKYLRVQAGTTNLVAYAQVTPEDRKKLDIYIQRLTAVPVSTLSRAEQKPYWINLYNALTIQVILDHYPTKTIFDIDISPGFFSNGPWKKKLVQVEGEQISLDDIEHRILRPVWKDARIHYGVNCASIGCPDLQPVPFTRENTDQLLTEAAKAFIASDRGIWFDGGKLGASSIYKWFSEDFGDNDREVIAHIRTYASPAVQKQLDQMRDISGYHYDWDLNDASRKAP